MQADIFRKRKISNLIFFSILLGITCFSITITKYDIIKGFECLPKAAGWAFLNFYPDEKSFARIPDILIKLRETVLISIASTTVASVFAFVFSLFGSKVTKVNGFLSVISRAIASFFRNVPIVVWAMVLLFSFGQSSLTGYFALFLGSFGFLTRAFIDTIDEVGESSVEALKASGAGYFEIISHAIVPSTLPQMISWILFTIETNIRSSTLIGILTGTGIGFSFNLYYKSLNYSAASLVVIVIVISVFAIEFVSNYIRRVIL